MSNKEAFAEQEYQFLSSVAIDDVPLNELVQDSIKDSVRSVPNEEEFLGVLSFIAYLFKKYGKHLSYSMGPGDPIDKTPEELLSWMKDKFYENKYEEIDYLIWFDLDLAVIPPEFIPPPIEEAE